MESKMKIEEVTNCLDKFNLYKEQEQLLIEDVEDLINKIKYNYTSNNSKKIDSLNISLVDKLDVILNIHNNNITVIEKNIDNYKTAEMNAKKIFENIEIR